MLSRREGLLFEQRASAHRPGLFRVDKRIACRGVVERSIVTGQFWIFATVADETGLTEAFCAHRWLPLPHCRAFMIQPRSVLRLRLSEVRLRACGLVGQLRLPSEIPSVPCFSALEPFAPPVRHRSDRAGHLRGRPSDAWRVSLHRPVPRARRDRPRHPQGAHRGGHGDVLRLVRTRVDLVDAFLEEPSRPFRRLHKRLGKATFVGACLLSASGAAIYALLYVV